MTLAVKPCCFAVWPVGQLGLHTRSTHARLDEIARLFCRSGAIYRVMVRHN